MNQNIKLFNNNNNYIDIKMENISVSSQIEKQRAFITLIKDIQVSLNSKEYKKQGYSFNEYVKMKWNISQ